jgi:hypothetical protein
MALEYRELGRIFGPKRDEATEGWTRNYITRSFIILKFHQILVGDQMKEDEMGGTCRVYLENKDFMLNFGRKISREESTRET